MRTQGEGVEKRSNFADVLYGWPLILLEQRAYFVR